MDRKIKTIDEQQAEIFMAYAKKRLKDNLQKIESMTPELQKYYEARSGGKLLFKYGATTIASMSSTGVITSATNIIANGTP